MKSIIERISPGEWRSVGSYVRTQGGANGVGYQIGESTINNPHTLGEDDANAKLWAASKEMLDILEQLANMSRPAAIDEFEHLKQDAINLLKQLNQ